jgi:hypothetical protein
MQCLNVRLCGAPSLAAVKPRAAVRAAASVAPARRMRVRAAATEEEEMRSPEDSIGMGGTQQPQLAPRSGWAATAGAVATSQTQGPRPSPPACAHPLDAQA